VKGNLILCSKTRQGGDVIDNTVGEVGCRTHEQDSVGVDQTTNSIDINLEFGLGARDPVQLDLEVVASLDEGRVSCVRNDPMDN
jgi:hypothetical protein